MNQDNNTIFHEKYTASDDQIKKEVTDYYTQVLGKKTDRHVQMQVLFPSELNSSSTILDYGCGLGGISKLYSDRYDCKVDAVDISAEQLKKARITFGHDENIRFINLTDFKFPKKNYDLVFSSQVIEHVHNPGIYLSEINKMLKNDGYLLIGLPNVVNLNYIINLLLFSEKRAKNRSVEVLHSYDKANHHINSWDPLHFITLLSSCGFELIKYLPTEGTPISNFLLKIPFFGRFMYRLPITTRLSYTMFFLVRKVKKVKIEVNS